MSTTIATKTVQLPIAPPLPPGTQQGGGMGHVVKNAAIFGAVGAAAGFGISFLTLPVIGQVSAPLAAAIGGVAGLAIGAIKGVLDNRRASGGGLGAPVFAGPGMAVGGAAAVSAPPGAVFLRA
jgi:hypothetical protein